VNLLTLVATAPGEAERYVYWQEMLAKAGLYLEAEETLASLHAERTAARERRAHLQANTILASAPRRWSLLPATPPKTRFSHVLPSTLPGQKHGTRLSKLTLRPSTNACKPASGSCTTPLPPRADRVMKTCTHTRRSFNTTFSASLHGAHTPLCPW
jgi:hypothetical protein